MLRLHLTMALVLQKRCRVNFDSEEEKVELVASKLVDATDFGTSSVVGVTIMQRLSLLPPQFSRRRFRAGGSTSYLIFGL